ncbi:hypothetical protein EDB19DRAFT_1907994 [Suillus lakei]|nr:hypothetical protein EDB19DRAFT_1907994 [Suillus lakei]
MTRKLAWLLYLISAKVSSSYSPADALCNQEYLISRCPINIKLISDMHARLCEFLITHMFSNFVGEICAKDEHPDISPARLLAGRAHVADVSKDHWLLSYTVQGWTLLGHVSDEDPYVMDVLSRLNSEIIRNTNEPRVLGTGTADHDQANPICAIVVSAIFGDEMSSV